VAHSAPTTRFRQGRRRLDRLADAPELPFADLLPARQVEETLRAEGVTFR
jgi:hypothetical protein